MSENRWPTPDHGPTAPPPHGGSSSTGRLLAFGVLFTIGVASVAGGVLLDRYVLLPRIFGFNGTSRSLRRGPPSAADREGWRSPERGRQAFHERLGDELALTQAQRAQMDSLMDRQERELRAAHEVVQPRIDSIVSDTRAKLDALLNAEQRQKLDSLRAHGAFGSPDGRGRRRGPGAPGGFGPPGGGERPQGPPPRGSGERAPHL